MKKNTNGCTAAILALVLGLGVLPCSGQLIFSEIAWSGTAANSSDEWIELRNESDTAIDLIGWQVVFGDTVIPLGEAGEDTLEVRTSTLAPAAFLVLERTDDNTLSDIVADVLYKGTLSNTGALVELRDPNGDVVDSILPGESGWPAGTPGDGDPAYCSMERTEAGDWESNNTVVRNGVDANGNPVNATPGQINSVTVIAQRAPVVELVDPIGEGSTQSGVVLIGWAASDPNGFDSALSITILLLADEGDDWTVLIENLANTGLYSWNTAELGLEGEVRFMVRALDSEGYFGEAVSPVFEVSNSSS